MPSRLGHPTAAARAVMRTNLCVKTLLDQGQIPREPGMSQQDDEMGRSLRDQQRRQ